MAAAARRALQAGGQDFLIIAVVGDDGEIRKIAQARHD